jgi:hypothetical protein
MANLCRVVRLAGLALVLGGGPVQAEEDLFGGKVAPLLRRHCLACHGPERKRGGLDLSTRAGALAGGENGPVLVPGSADRSLLLRVVNGPAPRMPRTGPKLTDGERVQLRRWIDAGAPWPAGVVLRVEGPAPVDGTWWSLQPLTTPPLPVLRNADHSARVRNPIDRFILAKLEEKGLAPSPEADRVTLVRRLYFDLIGLPPTPEEIRNFVEDRSPDAYEKLVDRLLDNPGYGERWGRHWLDVAHYADTHGYDKDKRRDHAWPYRDWVIRALNDDLPYADFIRRQLAGDVLAPTDPDSVAAAGFVVAGPWDFVGHVELREGTVDKEKTRLLDRDDMVSGAVTTFQSLTVGCARCHDHKFDPIPQKDYYRLQAVFSGVQRGDRTWKPGPFVGERQRLEKQRTTLLARLAEIGRKIEAATRPRLAELDRELTGLRRDLAGLPSPGGAPSPSNGWHSGISPRPDAVKWVQVDLGRSLPLDQIRLVPARPTDFPDSPGFGFPVRFRIETADEPSFTAPRLIEDHTAADFPNPGDVPHIVSVKKQQGRFVRVTATRLWKRLTDYVFALAELQVESGERNVAIGAPVTSGDSIEAGRWSRRYLVDDFDSRRKLPDLADAGQRKRIELAGQLVKREHERHEMEEKLAGKELLAERAAVRADLLRIETQLRERPMPQVYGPVPIPPRPIRVLHRGDVEQPRAEVTPGGLACVVGPDPDFKLSNPSEGARRVALADWIADARNPLTWKSIINRVWHYHFGRGIVDTPGDFGRNGSLPTHPELLDWLAVQFRDGGGSLKKMHRLIVCSAAYRQVSHDNPRSAREDADNRYLWRMNRTRLDAETVRDGVLAISGALDRTMGGPGFELFRFKDDHSPIYDHSALEKIHDPKTYRRTVYRFTVRSVPNPFLDALDCADPNINTPVRNTTLTALQALVLLNDPFMVRQANLFADRLRTARAGDPAGQVDLAYRLAFGRPPTDEERAAVVEHVRKHGLPTACRVLFNTSEFVFID